MRLELEAETLDDDTDGYEYGSRDGCVQAALGVYVTVVCLCVQIDESIGYRTC